MYLSFVILKRFINMSLHILSHYFICFLLVSNLSQAEKLAFRMEFSYTCSHPQCDGNFVITTPLTTTFDGMLQPVKFGCPGIVVAGYGKGMRISTFLYNAISRFHAQPSASHMNAAFVHPDDLAPVLHNCLPIEQDLLGLSTVDQVPVHSSGPHNLSFPYQSEHPENLCSQSLNSTTCPSFCFDCFKPRRKFNRVYKWKNSDGSTCLMPNFMYGNNLDADTLPFWSRKFLSLIHI